MSDAKSVSEKYIARYHIIEELASSSSSRIFLAKHSVSVPLPIVIKLFYSVRIDTLQEEAYFLEEIRLRRQLQHPFILPIMNSGVDKHTPYIAMAYLPSGSLYDRMLHSIEEPLSIEHTLIILAQIGQALHHAHQNNIFHGNLKPRNILLHEDGYVQLTDFTYITLQRNYNTNPDSMLYMAPEHTGNTTALSDQYALGCLAYELFTSRAFFQSSFSVKQQRTAAAMPTQYNPLLPLHIEQAILKAINLKPAQRYPNIPAFINALTIPTPMTASAASILSSIPTYTAQDVIPSSSLHDTIADEILLPITPESEPPVLPLEEDILEFLSQANEEQPSSPVVGTTISQQATVPQTPVLFINNNPMIVTPTLRPKKPLQWKPLFLLTSSIIIVLLLGNFIAARQSLTSTTNSNATHISATTVVQSTATSVTTQSPTLASTASDHTGIPTTPATTKPGTTSMPPSSSGTPTQGSTPTTTFTPTVNPPMLATTNQLRVNPASFNTSNCVPDNSNYRCTAMLQLSNQFQGQLSWQASSTGFTAKFSAPNGSIVAGQTIQAIIYIPAICPNNGTLRFGGSGLITTATWNC